MSHEQNTLLLENLAEWLGEQGREKQDIIKDELGYFVWVEGEEGNQKSYLPEYLQQIADYV